MRAAVLNEPFAVAVVDVPDPIPETPSDAVVEVVAACICGSDLWPYRGVHPTNPQQRLGHEFVGQVVAVGPDVRLRVGTFVIAPFSWSDGTCPACRDGVTVGCTNGGFWGQDGADGGQGQYVRVPFADATLVAVPDDPAPALVPALLTLSDVLATGHHAAISAQVGPGSTVVVVGDGAVWLCAVLASARLGAERIIIFGRHQQRTAIARQFGATDVVAERGRDAVRAVRDLTDGLGARHVLECVGTQEALTTAVHAARRGGFVGFVGVPHLDDPSPVSTIFDRSLSLRGGGAWVRTYLPQLLPDVLAGTLDASAVFDVTLPLEQVADGYAAMDSRSALKVLLQP